MDEFFHAVFGQEQLQAGVDLLGTVQTHHFLKQAARFCATQIEQRFLDLGQTGRIHRQRVVAHGQQQHGAAGVARKFAADTDRDTLGQAGGGDIGQRLQYRRVQRMVQVRHTGIVAIYSQQVLRQVVAADRDKIDPPAQRARLVNRSGHLNPSWRSSR